MHSNTNDAYNANVDGLAKDGTDEQKRVYLYLYDTQGAKAANSYSKTIKPIVDELYAKAMTQQYENSGLVGKIVLGATSQIAGGLSDYGMGFVGVAKAFTGNDSYTFPATPQYGAQGVRSAAGTAGGLPWTLSV